jgi:hypothetical protein
MIPKTKRVPSLSGVNPDWRAMTTPSVADRLLGRVLGGSLESATFRLVGGSLVLAGVLALIVWAI